jgi:Holliday junction resolvase RusA-like endonuclease
MNDLCAHCGGKRVSEKISPLGDAGDLLVEISCDSKKCGKSTTLTLRIGEPLPLLTLHGRPSVLKNSKRIFSRGRGKRAIVLPSSKYEAWEENAMATLSRSFKRPLIIDPVCVRYEFFFATRQAEPDVSNLIEGPQDVLQKAGVIKNDRLVMRVIGGKYFGHDPRTEILISPYQIHTNG